MFFTRLIAFVLGSLVVTTASAQSVSLAPYVYQDIYSSQFANFSHWSGILQTGDNAIDIGYAVCNLDTSTSLIYKWDAPNITLGPGGRLPPGKCNTLHRTVSAIEHDQNAIISFTQAGRNHPAPAHISKLPLPIPTNLLPHILRNRLRTFYGPESKSAQPNLADLIITQTRSDGLVHHLISWNPPSVAIAIPADAFGTSPTDVVQFIKNAGYWASFSSLEEALFKPNDSPLSPDRMSSQVIVIDRGKSSAPLEFALEGKTGSVTRSFVSVIDREQKLLVIDSEISVFSLQ
jgi:hypothetical protein